jgi:hypothetical protein
MFLMAQLAWIGIQKWQFNHFASYSARVWSVQKDDDPEESLMRLQIGVLFLRWNLYNRDYVKYMWAEGEDSKEIDDETYTGVNYEGVAPLLPLFRGQIGETLVSIPGEVSSLVPGGLPSSGLVRFAAFIPMEKEPEEEPDESNRDNDCDDTPCSSGNGRD